MRSLGFCVCVVSLALGLASPAAAQDKVGARAAAMQGSEALQNGDFRQALDYLARAEQLHHATPHLLMMAHAHLGLKELVEARELLLAIINEPLPERANDAQRRTLEAARADLAALEPRLPYLTISVKGGPGEALRLTLNGAEIPASLLDISHPVNPGSHVLKASAERWESDETPVLIEEGARQTVILEMRPTADPRAVEHTSAPSPEPPPNDTLRIAGYSALGLGVVGAGLGTFFLVGAGADSSDADDILGSECSAGAAGQSLCSSSAALRIAALDEDAADKRTWATVSFAVGGAALATGVVLLVLDAQGKETPKAGLRARPWFGLGSAGIMGSF